MPTSVGAILVLVFGVVPGALGNHVFRALIGSDWREKELAAVIRYVAFSVVGLAVYTVAADVLGWWGPIHVLPSTYASLNESMLLRVVVPYMGHILGGGVAGLLGVGGELILAKTAKSTYHPCAWDMFAGELAEGRWVVITLATGDVYAGYIEVADTGVAQDERDIVLREPAKLGADGQYVAMEYREIFLPSRQIESVGIIFDGSKDVPKGVMPGTSLFPET